MGNKWGFLMPNHPEIIIMRHGETVWNCEQRMQGTLDSALTARGRAQAATLRRLIGRMDLGPRYRAWCSPRGRARETANIALAPHFDNIREDARLAEISVGRIEGMRLADARVAFPDIFAGGGLLDWYFRDHGGESYAQFAGRLQSWLDDLEHPAIVITHGVASRVLRGLVLGLDLAGMAALPDGQGGLFRLCDGRHEQWPRRARE
ncbi:MAG: histidine phosphatase family protein [Paracoccaceae bacterium]